MIQKRKKSFCRIKFQIKNILIKHDISVPLIFRSNFCHRTAWLVHSVITDDSTLPTSQIPKAYCFESVQYLNLSLGSQNRISKTLTSDEKLNIFSYIYETDILKKGKFVPQKCDRLLSDQITDCLQYSQTNRHHAKCIFQTLLGSSMTPTPYLQLIY